MRSRRLDLLLERGALSVERGPSFERETMRDVELSKFCHGEPLRESRVSVIAFGLDKEGKASNDGRQSDEIGDWLHNVPVEINPHHIGQKTELEAKVDEKSKHELVGVRLGDFVEFLLFSV